MALAATRLVEATVLAARATGTLALAPPLRKRVLPESNVSARTRTIRCLELTRSSRGARNVLRICLIRDVAAPPAMRILSGESRLRYASGAVQPRLPRLTVPAGVV